MKALAVITLSLFLVLFGLKMLSSDDLEEEVLEEKVVLAPKPKTKPAKLKPVKKYPSLRKDKKKKVADQKNSIQLKKVVQVPTQKTGEAPKATAYDFKDFVYVDEQENLYVESVIVDGDDAVTFGDVLIGTAEEVYRRAKNGDHVSINKPAAWTEGVVPYSVSKELESRKEMIIEAMGKLEEAAQGGLRFIVRSDQENYLSFEKGTQNCYSFVGMRGGSQKVSLSMNCGVHEIMHELMHAIGFFHEQNREDRDQFIEVHFYNIDEKYHPQFKKVPNSWQHLFDSDFDFKSIMLYPPTAFSMYEGDYSMTTVEGDPYALEYETLSELDKVRIRLLYPAE